MQFHPADALKVAGAWIVTTTIALTWVHLTRQATIPKSAYAAFVIAVRLLFVYGLAYALFCFCLGIPVEVVLILSGIILLLAPIARLDMVPGNDVVGIAIGLTILVPVYAIKQFVLGFPDQDEIMLVPPAHSARDDLSPLIQAIGSVTATLRPSGKVDVGGTTYSASTADGKYLDLGATIRVSAVRNNSLIVIAVEPHQEPLR